MTMKRKWTNLRQSRKAQSLVEFALAGMLLFMLLAAAVDLGRAYYTYIVVENMAGEGAAYLSQNPDNDCRPSGCSGNINNTFQGRARNVAVSAGRVINPTHIVPATAVRVNIAQNQRCAGRQFQVSVGYDMDDLFFPALLGVRKLTIGATSQSSFWSSGLSAVCPTPTPLP